jgi:hypothetical protein
MMLNSNTINMSVFNLSIGVILVFNNIAISYGYVYCLDVI